MRRTRLRASASTASGNREIRLTGSRRSDPDHDVVFGDQLHVLGLTARLRLDDLPDARKDDALVGPPFPFRRARLDAHAQHVVGGERHLLLGGVDHALRDTVAARSTDSACSAERQRLAAERDSAPDLTRELDEVLVVHAGQRQHVCAFGRRC